MQEVRITLNDFVKQLAQTVDDDWHDSYEETDEMLCEWFQACAESVADVLRIVVATGDGPDWIKRPLILCLFEDANVLERFFSYLRRTSSL